MEDRKDTSSPSLGSALRPVRPNETSGGLSANLQSHLNARHASQSNLLSDTSNEQSPLLPAQNADGRESGSDIEETLIQALDCHDEQMQESKSPWYFFVLTLSVGG